MNPKELYPEIEPYDMGFVSVGDGHEIYWEVSGNPQGKPVLFVHGGPGAGTGAAHRRFFDPAHYRIVLFDQRGCGKSLPLGSLENNDTPHLIADMELLRQKLAIESWVVFGGSWGSTLSLAYAQAHPERTDGLVVRGIFLSRPKELEWYLSAQGVGSIFPEAYENFISLLSEEERADVLESYYKRLTDPDPSIHLPAAKSWSSYEASCVTLLPNADIIKASLDDQRALPVGRLIAHYFVNGCFLPKGGLLGGIDRIRNISAVIVHGRYDIVCPASTAYDLHKAWPEAEFKFIDDAGHSAFEPGIAKALVEAMDKLRTLD